MAADYCKHSELVGQCPICARDARIRELEAALTGKDRILERHVRWREKALRLLSACPPTQEVSDFIALSTTRMIEASQSDAAAVTRDGEGK